MTANAEPRGFTTTDWFAASLAIAVVIAKPKFGAVYIDASLAVILLVISGLHLSFLCVAIGRQIRFSRKPASGEWYLVYASAAVLVIDLPPPDTFLDWVHRTLRDAPLVEWTTWRAALGWTTAVLCAAFVLVSWRKPQLRASSLWKLAVPVVGLTFAWGPLLLFRTYMTLPAMDRIEVPLEWYQRAYIELQTAVQIFPVLLLCYAVVFLATIHNRKPRSRWSWLDWSSATLAVLAGLANATPFSAAFLATTEWTFPLVHWPSFFAALFIAYRATRAKVSERIDE